MKKPSKEIQKVIDRGMTVGELVELLKTFPQDLKVGVAGHFGEYIPIDKNDFFYYEKRTTFVIADDDWRHQNRYPMNFLEVEAPSRGEEPN